MWVVLRYMKQLLIHKNFYFDLFYLYLLCHLRVATCNIEKRMQEDIQIHVVHMFDVGIIMSMKSNCQTSEGRAGHAG